MGSYALRLRRPIFAFVFLLAGACALRAQDPSELVLKAKVRDFKEFNPLDTEGMHPHFNTQNGCSALELGSNTVEPMIDLNGPTGAGFDGDERDPKLLQPMASGLARCYSPADRFSDWFQDKSSDINRAFQVELRFVRDPATGLYRFSSNAFFPIDDGSAFSKFNPTDPEPFGHLQTGTVDNIDLSKHNYGFTLELHTKFTYVQGLGHTFEFRGDDDLWAFINGHRVVDLGGVHQTQTATVNLDSLASAIGLADGNTYPMDFFFAERHTASSSCIITTQIQLTPIAVRELRRAGAAPWGLATGSRAKVSILDGQGRLLRVLGGSQAGTTWDGRDASGGEAAPGRYFWRAVGQGGETRMGRLLLPSR